MRGGQGRWPGCAVRPAGANTAQDTKCVCWLCSVLAVGCADQGKIKAAWHSRWPECEAMQGGTGKTICRAAPCLITPPSPLHPHQPPTCKAPLPTMMPSTHQHHNQPNTRPPPPPPSTTLLQCSRYPPPPSLGELTNCNTPIPHIHTRPSPPPYLQSPSAHHDAVTASFLQEAEGR